MLHALRSKLFRPRFLLNLPVAILAGALLCTGMQGASASAQDAPSIVGTSPLPGLAGATDWLNSRPLTPRDLKGKVVLVDFWDYSCINCIRAVPYVRAWADKYKSAGLVVIAVHTPEFDVEKQTANVERAAKRFGITYPIAVDSNRAIWNAFHNEYWPADYLIDAKGKVRFEHFGEGEYAQTEQQIQQLLAEADGHKMSGGVAEVHGQGEMAAADVNAIRSPETYIGYARAAHFSSPGGIVQDEEHTYAEPVLHQLNDWGLVGKWEDGEQSAVLKAPGGRIVFRFHARDLHLVLGPAGRSAKPVKFKVTIDGHAPGADHGVDIDAAGNGVMTADRLYQLVRQQGTVADHTFAIEFEDTGVQAFSFTFG